MPLLSFYYEGYITTLIFGNRRKWNSDYFIVMIGIVISLAVSLAAAVIWTWTCKSESEEQHPTVSYHKKCISNLQLKSESGTTEYTIDTGFIVDSHATTGPNKCGYKTTDPVNYYGHLVPPALWSFSVWDYFTPYILELLLAQTLHDNASSLETALGQLTADAARNAKRKVTKLKVAANELKGLLTDLNSASGFELVSKGKLVLAKYNEVERLYKEVATDEQAKKRTQQFEQVTTAFEALQTDSTADGQSTNEITNIRNNDIKGDTGKGDQLDAKAGQLKSAADSLSTKAGQLEEAAKQGGPLKPLEEPAGSLRDAAKKDPTSGDTESLHYHAGQLATQPSGLEGLATAVITKFDDVTTKYNALMEKAKRINQETNQKVTDVETKFEELKAIYDGILNLTKLKTKAKALKSTAEGQTTTELNTLGQKPTELATKAQTLSDEAKLISDSELSPQAQKLKDAAKKDGLDDTDSLHKKATELSSNTTYEKAKDVIEAFDTVKHNFDQLIKVAIENNKLHDPLVQNVKSKFEDLTTYYDTMMPFTKIRYYSDKISTEATTLRNSGSGTTEAYKIVKYFDSMEHACNKLGGDDRQKVEKQFEALKDLYDNILNVTKMKHYSDQVYIKAPQIATGNATPSEVKTLIDKLENVYNALGTSNLGAQNNVKDAWEALKNVIDGAMKWWKFWWIIAPSIICQWSKAIYSYSTDEKLRAAAGTSESEPSDGLRALAKALHDKANALNTAVTATDNAEAARVLQHKVGKDDTTDGKLRKLAKTLYEKAKELASAAPGTHDNALKQKAGENENDGLRNLAKELYEAAKALQEAVGEGGTGYTEANELATAVGQDESNGIRHALKNVSSDQNQAKAVKDAYEDTSGDGVKPKFEKVKKLGSSYKAISSIRSQYEAVTSPGDPKTKAQELKDAVGQEETSPGTLREALASLGTHNAGQPGDLPTLANAVKDKYKEVKGAYDEVVKQKESYTQGQGKPEYTQVVNDGRLSIMPKYDIKGTSEKGKYLEEKAKELESKANTLKNTAESKFSDAGNVGAAAGDLASKAEALNRAATALPGGEELTELQVPATALAKAAKGPDTGTDKTSLYTKASELSGDQTNHDKAKAVIEAFGKVKAAYETLAGQDKYKQYKDQPSPPQSPEQRKVQNVDDAWGKVNTQFEALCKAVIKQFANEVESKATTLQDKYDKFKDVKSTIEIKTGTSNSTSTKTIKVTNLPHINDTFKPRQIKFWWIITPSIVTKWLKFLTHKLALDTVTDDKLRVAAGANKTQGLRGKAQTLYERANDLYSAVIDVSKDDAAKVLKAKAGGKDDEGKLRKLAEKLHGAANKLAQAVGAKDDDAPQNLANEIGENETTKDKLRDKLRELAEADTSQLEELKRKATAVKQQYDAANLKFAEVEKQNKEDKYKDGDRPEKYQAVEKAWDAFNSVYKPEELLKDAVGDGAGESRGLQLKLNQLGTAGTGDIKSLAKAVKEKYSKFDGSGVKQKFQFVQAQASAYEAESGNIKSEKYTPLVTAWINFNVYKKFINKCYECVK
ncbi:Tpr-related protein family member, putative [Theileria annulata]|uniref:Tpr-related protein family member, putative n=1 Tax=Theileria annulata TaxID=5874 RepID=Q4UHI3_THEAN|nr:Tpr-related protein family member, putative [Theileria annulata]CAI73456.1 Tpr-related protein family member, putative [Theileria annulata]|eukprot:XP_954133.1 Tpr-related protein family member, putative [Theileria annulata]